MLPDPKMGPTRKPIKLEPTTLVYLTPWVEVEFGWGKRPEGYVVFADRAQAETKTRDDSSSGRGSDGYFGPERPLRIIVMQWQHVLTSDPKHPLTPDVARSLERGDYGWTHDYWEPNPNAIEETIDLT